MKQLKRILVSVGFLSVFLLHGCGGGSGSASSSGQSGSVSAANGSALHSTETSLVTSFTLYGTQGDSNTAIAGEIVGNIITVQVPSDTTFDPTATFVASFRAADPDGHDITKLTKSGS